MSMQNHRDQDYSHLNLEQPPSDIRSDLLLVNLLRKSHDHLMTNHGLLTNVGTSGKWQLII